MSNLQMEQFSARRRALENPYAYIDEMEILQTVGGAVLGVEASVTELRASRKLLENPYAYSDGSGGFSGLKQPHSTKGRKVAGTSSHAYSYLNHPKAIIFNNAEIESRVGGLHERLWRERSVILGVPTPADPVNLLDPGIALRMIGYDFQVVEGLGGTRNSGGMLEVAGVIDNETRTVRISSQFSQTVKTFTAAHELGHAVLHQHAMGVHRDKPIEGGSYSRERAEIEADKFATYFLMPANLVRARFLATFGEPILVLSEELSFALTGKPLSELLRTFKTRRHFSRLIASAQLFNGFQVKTMAEQFRVSTETMAIRLEELSLVPA